MTTDPTALPNPRRRLLAFAPALAALPWCAPSTAQEAPAYASWSATELLLDNGAVRRRIALPGPGTGLATVDYRGARAPSRFFAGHDGSKPRRSDEFRFLVDGKAVTSASGWRVKNIAAARDAHGGHGARIALDSVDGRLSVAVEYLLYPGLPLVRKRLAVTNRGRRRVRIESVEIERFEMEEYYPGTYGWIYSDYGRRKSLAPFLGTRQDCLMALHNPDWQEGIVLGNEAPGVLKHMAAFYDSRALVAGLTPAGQPYAFRRHLAPGRSWESPQVFSIVYANARTFETILNSVVPDFVRRHLGSRLAANPHRPGFVYNTWEPFQTDINEALLLELVDAAADAGAQEFVIDDGWQDVNGDWGVDRARFPRGLGPVIERIRQRGMKPGLWVSVGSADKHSRVFRAHPDWFVENRAGQLTNLHLESWAGDKLTACFTTGWRDYIGGVLARLVREHGLVYLKLDFAVVTSSYVFDLKRNGCHARKHSHADQPESLALNHQAMWDLFDGLHRQFPQLFIDCTFEAMGGMQLIDYAMLRHAEGNWLSNFNEADAANDLRIRQMAWWRAPAMPAAALVIGNARLEDGGVETHLQSLAGTLPMLLGDPRKMDAARKALCRRYSAWFSALHQRSGYMDYRQDLPGFGEPQEGRWDGFQRINTDSGAGGMVGVFRHGAPDAAVTARVGHLQARATYLVLDMEGREVARASGAQLGSQGFAVRIDEDHGGRLLEVRRL
ncbi:glycoside hydrolase family 36 protein [Pseudoduganella lutea]|uniref:Alpha-galactosidase n=1 Tax=Pseudoduganella lutea TaxID=321985 RepID=A0A4P6KT55_9BURK|nr:glycoside hydrolase family 36 protein [Pseudoduganella lutea]QBE61906.1 alpha-galactosidase [Pseudoduganella lutea]